MDTQSLQAYLWSINDLIEITAVPTSKWQDSGVSDQTV
jgi:hypothetical protein